MLQKLDVLAAQAMATMELALPAIAALRDGSYRLLSRRAQAEQRRARDAVRRLRWPLKVLKPLPIGATAGRPRSPAMAMR
ncbi:MAG: hypothetical protein ACLQT7_08650 [Candidatus Dormibacteria bacterium]